MRFMGFLWKSTMEVIEVVQKRVCFANFVRFDTN
jgi:hypothetical protein